MSNFNWQVYTYQLTEAFNNTSPDQISKVIRQIEKTIKSERSIFVIGNGGSAATASHFCVDLSKGVSTRIEKSIRAIPLMDLVPIQTAWSNDSSYEDAVGSSIKNFAKHSDVLIAITGSGNSENLIRSCLIAKKLSMTVIGMTGYNGGKITKFLDLEINVPSSDMQVIEDSHHAICHFISKSIFN